MNALSDRNKRRELVNELIVLMEKYGQRLLQDDGMAIFIHPEADCYYVNFRPIGLNESHVPSVAGIHLHPITEPLP